MWGNNYGNQQGYNGNQQQGNYSNNRGNGGGGGISAKLLMTIAIAVLILLAYTGVLDTSQVVKIIAGGFVFFYVITAFSGTGKRNGNRGQGNNQQGNGYNNNNNYRG